MDLETPDKSYKKVTKVKSRKSSRQRKASTRARESEEPLEPPQKRSRRADCDARRRAAKKSKLDEFNDLERRVAALIGRVTELEEELRARAAATA